MREIDEAFHHLSGAFTHLAEFQGLHFKYAVKDGAMLIEQRRAGRYFYWLLVGDRFKLVHASLASRFKRMAPITNSTFTPDHTYNAEQPTA